MIWTLPAPAKLNLFLHITGVRDDGYHNLQTIFQLLDYSDEVTLLRRDDGVIRRTEGLAEVEPSDDLIVKAAQALKNYTGTTYGADVGVVKRLPVGGGIGGGSSDAATTLLGLNALWECHLSTDELLGIAVTLGADVPVFVAGHSAWAEGIGEQLTPMDLPEIWFLVLHPGVFVSTAKLFSSEVLTRNKSILKMRDFTDTDIENIFEVIVREQHPEVDLSLSWLNQFSTARMTGTGSCIFAGFDSFEEAEKVLKDMPSKWKGFVAKAVNTSPVFEAINQYSKS
ncbi:4-(cytidine 5'-diphospho)-2-C-methyl-D-erythritol kinase [Leucothrix mucor]|uniref:4-(cytidine 5'-diphospho)-2-C-methyl-D-erythritol kinase n=1 Tax=Leucothrix mucor TaxID=45248 RepID=UPI0003B4C21C|nr:4-(cytidine 5'-diphospho)-2-C-methyl-D-erythritol kinase [Leucothrix mucor]